MAATGLRQGVSVHKARAFSRSEGETYLVNFVKILDVALGLRANLCGIARPAHTGFPPPMLSLVLCVVKSRPSSELSRRWYARSRCRGKARG